MTRLEPPCLKVRRSLPVHAEVPARLRLWDAKEHPLSDVQDTEITTAGWPLRHWLLEYHN